MKNREENEEVNLARLIYLYLMIIGIAIGGLVLTSIEPNILRQFRDWIPAQTFNSYYLTWFAVSTISGLLCFFGGILCQFLQGRNCLENVLWYVSILIATLFFATIFFQILRTGSVAGLGTTLGTLLVSAIVTLVMSFIFYTINFSSRDNFWPFTTIIILSTSAFNWLYLSMIARISVF
jgi:hypothetical protein